MTPDEFARKAELQFSDSSLLQRALTHRSYLNENPEFLEDNERLEFLGDAALDFLAAQWLYNRFPELDEGHMTRLRSALVRTEQLADFAREIQLGETLFLGKGEDSSGGRDRPALLCATFEALIGALYLDSGLDAVAEFIEPRFEQAAEIALEGEMLFDPRSVLQMWAQSEIGTTPRYETTDSYGPDHARHFIVEVILANGIRASGQGRSKQEAAQEAAKTALEIIGHPLNGL
jgi:ribonuclease-3